MLALALGGCGSDTPPADTGQAAPTTVTVTATVAPGRATRAGFEAAGKTWPLTVDAGTLSCKGQAVWFTADDGRVFAVNGAARSQRPEARLDPVWRFDEAIGGGVRVSVGDLIAEGLKLC